MRAIPVPEKKETIVQGLTLKSIGFALAVAMAPAAVYAQSGYPAKPITLVAAFATGGDSDLSGRDLAQHAQK